MAHKMITSGYPMEEAYGYCRAIKAGDTVYLAGTTARGNDLELDTLGQTRAIFLLLEEALKKAGSELSHVVRSTIYLLDIGEADKVGRIHGSHFKGHKPVLTIVQVSGLISKARVEIEVTSVIPKVP